MQLFARCADQDHLLMRKAFRMELQLNCQLIKSNEFMLAFGDEFFQVDIR
jgi:hypothetical protein